MKSLRWVAADGNTIAGNFTQGNPIAISLRRATPRALHRDCRTARLEAGSVAGPVEMLVIDTVEKPSEN